MAANNEATNTVDPIQRIAGHIPSLTPADERDINEKIARIAACALTGRTAGEPDLADLAIRTCNCKRRIDGFYDYVDHLVQVLLADRPHTSARSRGVWQVGMDCPHRRADGDPCLLTPGHDGDHVFV